MRKTVIFSFKNRGIGRVAIKTIWCYESFGLYKQHINLCRAESAEFFIYFLLCADEKFHKTSIKQF